MIRLITSLALVALATAAAAATPAQRLKLEHPGPEATLALPAMERAKLLEQDLERFRQGLPPRYGQPVKLGDRAIDLERGGEWRRDGENWIWRLAIEAPGATSLDIGFEDAWLPAGAALYFYDAKGAMVRGPYRDRNNRADGQLWVPMVPGDSAVVELVIPEAMRPHARLRLGQVNYGFRFADRPDEMSKSGSCNVDVVCPEGNGFRDQIRGAATYGIGSSGTFCSGQMINNTANDNTPYFITANHCDVNSSDAGSLTVYWNYQSGTCRTPGSAASGQPLPLSGDVQTGATLVAEAVAGGGVVGNDFSLLRLDEQPPESFNVHWVGWDRGGSAPATATTIHHPQGDEKRISHTVIPLTTTGYLSETGGGTSHWRVRAWDVGTTEPGSSGSGLYDPNGRLIGLLSGGFASCASDPAVCSGNAGACDWYGRISQAFTAGNAANRRLADWLDPLDSGAVTVDGIDACDQPEIVLVSNENPAEAGEPVTFVASVSGGQAPYAVRWDLDGDGGIDSTEFEVTASFPDVLETNIVVEVIDSTGCTASASLGQVIRAPAIEVTGTGAPVQQCGDGDGNLEPGEIWQFPVTLRNNGMGLMRDGIAAFALNAGGGSSLTDDFGYSLEDSSGGVCPFDFQDIAGSGTAIAFDDEDDDARPVELGGPGFEFYGQALDQVAVSTNGYLSSDPNDAGQDFSNDCPIPAPPSSGGGARLAVLHDDLAGGQVLHQYFADCPRPGDSPEGAGCNVFQWEDVDYFDGAAGATFQALLYDGSNQIVYQYLSGNPRMGSSQTVGIQNGAASDGLAYACESPGAVPNENAVCFFHPDSQPVLATTQGLVVGNPAIELGDLAPGASITVNVVVEIGDDFPCGSRFALDYLGTAHGGGFSNTPEVSIVNVITSGTCNSPAQCALPDAFRSDLEDGFWFSALRPGNGIDLHFIDDRMYSAWYTAEAGRVPVWYYVQTRNGQARVGNQIRADILRFTNQGSPASIDVSFEVVGEAVFSFLDEDEAVMTWIIDGAANGEGLVFFDIDAAPVDDVITDQWYNLDQSGWGLGVHRQGSQEFNAVYLYGIDGEPRWVVTIENPLTTGTAGVSAARVHCPGCAYIPTTLVPGGTMTRTFGNDGTGSITLEVNVEGDQPIQWLRTNLPLVEINPPAAK